MVTLTHAIACHSMCGNLDGWGGGGGGGGGGKGEGEGEGGGGDLSTYIGNCTTMQLAQ